ncbi:hypothetical protein Tco_0911750 [Tanacetum coccineum]|uniref:Uncharacterized protein n=1 Tax=Tanacetum coccineum TaxID=301880 RepID=A0ABQ5CWL5_9ASTR
MGKMVRWLDDEILRDQIPTLRRDLLGVARFLRWVEAEMVSPEVEVEVEFHRLDNQSIERDRLNGIGFVLDFVEFISFTFGDKEMISVIEAVSR